MKMVSFEAELISKGDVNMDLRQWQRNVNGSMSQTIPCVKYSV